MFTTFYEEIINLKLKDQDLEKRIKLLNLLRKRFKN